MSRHTFTCLILVAMCLAFFEAKWTVVEGLWHAQVDVVPVLLAFAALNGGWAAVAGFSFLAGAWVDVLSANPVGTSILSLFLTALVIQGFREIILKGQWAAQGFVAGLGGMLNPVFALTALRLSGYEPLSSWMFLWQILVNGLVCAFLAPILFPILNIIDRSVSYQPVRSGWGRQVVEVKRGKHYRIQ